MSHYHCVPKPLVASSANLTTKPALALALGISAFPTADATL